jgi:methyl-accepting chemotaxis protein
MLENVRIGPKLVGGFLAIAALVAVVAVVGYLSITDINRHARELGNDRLPGLDGLLILSEVQSAVSAAERGLVNDRMMAPEVRDAQYAWCDQAWERADEAWKEYEAVPKSAEETAAWKSFTPKWNAWKASHQHVRTAAESTDGLLLRGRGLDDPEVVAMEAEAFDASLKTGGLLLAANKDLARMVEMNKAAAAASTRWAREAAARATTKLVFFTLAAAALAAALGIFLARSITRPLARGVEMMRELGQGHLSGRLRMRRRDEIGLLAESMDRFADDLQGQVVGTMQRIAAGDLSCEIEVKDDQDEISPALQQTVASLRGLVAEASRLSRAAAEGELAARSDVSQYQGGYREVLQGVNETLEAIIAPVDLAAQYLDRIRRGDLPPRITGEYKGDFNELKNNLNGCCDAIEALVADTSLLSRASAEGSLATRADASLHQGAFAKIIQAVDDTLDAVIDPLNMAARHIARISQGDIPPRITETYRGDFNEIKNNLNLCCEAVTNLVSDVNTLSRAAVDGQLGTRVETGRHGGEFAKIVQGMNDTLDAVIGPLNTAALYVDCLSKGTLPPLIEDEYPGDFNEVRNNLNTCVESIEALVRDARVLSQATMEGRLRTRVDAEAHSGEYGSIMAGFNRTLDTLVGYIDAMPAPVMTVGRDFTVRYMNKTGADLIGLPADRIAGSKCSSLFRTSHCETGQCACDRAMRAGKTETAETEAHPHGLDLEVSYSGIPIKDESGQVIGALEVISDQTAIKQAARLSQKQAAFQEKEVSRLVTGLGKLAEGDLDLDLSVAEGDADTQALRCNFLAINESLGQARAAIAGLVQDAIVLSQAAAEGILTSRADIDAHQGMYRCIMEGLNTTTDALVAPIMKIIEHLDHLSNGVVDDQITEEYKGDFNQLKQAFNRSFGAVNSLISDTQMLARAAVEGRLDVRADATKHQGDFRKIVQGVNDTLDALITPLQGTIEHLGHLSNGLVDDHITQDYKGDFIKLKDAFNRSFDAVNALISDSQMLAQAAVQGRLDVRADVAKHQGDFRKVVQGVNDTLDAVIDPIKEAADVLQKMAERDLTARMQGSYSGDHARIKEALNQAVQNLDEGMQQVAVAVEQVATAAAEIGSGSQTLAQGASEQASSLEEVSSSLQEVTTMTRQSAGNAKEARGLAEGARGSANKGLESMNRLSEAMERIKTSSDATAKIVKTIDEIAFQTNLLALNAAVEAARAGDAGKGFAVVAEEVRNLAMRSADAAKNTANLIEESVRNAENGVELNQEVLAKLQEINEQTVKVGEVMSEIAAGSEHQTVGIEQITASVDQMDQVTQQNAASSEESASAAEELSGQSEELRSMVARFRLSNVAPPSARRSPVMSDRSAPARPAANASRNAAVAQAQRKPQLQVIKGKTGGAGTELPQDPEEFIPFRDDDDSVLRSF